MSHDDNASVSDERRGPKRSPEKALLSLAYSNDWLAKALDIGGANPSCDCNACLLCAYRTISNALAELLRLREQVKSAHLALDVVATGIWRDMDRGDCGVLGGSMAVDLIESALKQLPPRDAAREERTS